MAGAFSFSSIFPVAAIAAIGIAGATSATLLCRLRRATFDAFKVLSRKPLKFIITQLLMSGWIVQEKIHCSISLFSKSPECPGLHEKQNKRGTVNHKKEGNDVGKYKPIFLVVRSLLKHPDHHSQSQERHDQPNQLGQKFFHNDDRIQI